MLKKLIFGPQKMEKIDFLQNLDLPDLAEHGRGLPQYPATSSHWPFSWRIQYIKNLLPQWCELRGCSWCHELHHQEAEQGSSLERNL